MLTKGIVSLKIRATTYGKTLSQKYDKREKAFNGMVLWWGCLYSQK